MNDDFRYSWSVNSESWGRYITRTRIKYYTYFSIVLVFLLILNPSAWYVILPFVLVILFIWSLSFRKKIRYLLCQYSELSDGSVHISYLNAGAHCSCEMKIDDLDASVIIRPWKYDGYSLKFKVDEINSIELIPNRVLGMKDFYRIASSMKANGLNQLPRI